MSTVRALVCVSILAALLAVPEPASAQLKGHYVPGFTGLNNGSQGPPALTIVFPIYFYTTDTLKDDDGDELGTHPRINATFFGPGLLRVTDVKLLGGNLGGQILPIAFMKERLEGPSLDVRSGRPRLATLEIHSDKKDSGIKVGNILTFEGGLGRSLYKKVDGTPIPCITTIGLTYYTQVKASADSGPLGLGLLQDRKDHVFGIGAEGSVFLPKQKLLLGLRYVAEFGAINRTQGHTFISRSPTRRSHL